MMLSEQDKEARRILREWEREAPLGFNSVIVAYVRRLEARVAERDARIAAARTALDKAWRAAPDYLCGDLDEVLDVLNGEAGA